MPPPQRRSWTLEAAREMLSEVRSRTERAVRECEELLSERRAASGSKAEADVLEERVQDCVNQWVRAMEALGLEVKGLWLVDFDNGEGYYCWKWPEQTLEHYHGYEEGFDGRIRIQ